MKHVRSQENTVEIIDRTDASAGNNDRALPSAGDHKIVRQAHEFMLDGAFKNSELTLDILAQKIRVNRKRLSRAINAVTGKNFSSFVNEYRIKEALRIMSQTPNPYMEELYEQAGFRSRPSFYRIFKQITGLSPREFRIKE